jgi:tRNA (uracil-5-)-methyltransferase
LIDSSSNAAVGDSSTPGEQSRVPGVTNDKNQTESSTAAASAPAAGPVKNRRGGGGAAGAGAGHNNGKRRGGGGGGGAAKVKAVKPGGAEEAGAFDVVALLGRARVDELDAASSDRNWKKESEAEWGYGATGKDIEVDIVALNSHGESRDAAGGRGVYSIGLAH